MSQSAALNAAPPPWLASVELIAAAFSGDVAPGMPRYLHLKATIIRLIQTGELRSGEQLPPDQQLTGPLGISLGTVQKAFGGLASEGWISREHGRGTFVAAPRRPVGELWHYRFMDPQTGEFLPVYSRLLRRHKVAADARVIEALGADPDGHVLIERQIDIGGKFNCYSELFVCAGRFSRLLKLPSSAFESVNLKAVFAEEFGAPTIGVKQFMRAVTFTHDVVKMLGVAQRAVGMLLEVTALTYGNAPFSHQRIYVPRTDYPLDISPVQYRVTRNDQIEERGTRLASEPPAGTGSERRGRTLKR